MDRTHKPPPAVVHNTIPQSAYLTKSLRRSKRLRNGKISPERLSTIVVIPHLSPLMSTQWFPLQCRQYLLCTPILGSKSVSITNNRKMYVLRLYVSSNVFNMISLQHVRARDTYERVLLGNPKHAKAFQRLGWLYHQDGSSFQNQDRAIEYLTNSIISGK